MCNKHDRNKIMRVLWFTISNSCYIPEGKFSGGDHYNGGGWVSSAEEAIRKENNVTLAVSFILDGQPKKAIQNGITYYPIKSMHASRFFRIKDKVKALFMPAKSYENSIWPFYLNQFKQVVDDFKPDIIHIWGSERWFGLVWKITNIPVILHLQGLINPYINAYNPPGITWRDTVKIQKMSTLKALYIKKRWQGATYREKEIFKGITACLGRTDWDRRVAFCLNPKISYSHVDEILRDVFYETSTRKIPNKLTIITTISAPPYKGYDLVLKTAKILKENLDMDFDWKCYGNIEPQFIEKAIDICHTNVDVHLMGVATSEQLREAELSSTLYFHSSYIDNSPNSLCEAQMLGIPVVSTNVGGIPSLVTHGIDGYLIPANDPYQAAFFIHHLYNNPEQNMSMGEKGKRIAQQRHNVENVVSQIMGTYNSMLNR